MLASPVVVSLFRFHVCSSLVISHKKLLRYYLYTPIVYLCQRKINRLPQKKKKILNYKSLYAKETFMENEYSIPQNRKRKNSKEPYYRKRLERVSEGEQIDPIPIPFWPGMSTVPPGSPCPRIGCPALGRRALEPVSPREIPERSG